MYAIAPEPVYTQGSESNLWSKSAFHDMVKRMALLEHFGMAEDIANVDHADVQSQSGTAPNPLTVSCPDCCRVMSKYRDHT